MLFQIHRVAAVGVALLVAMTGCTKTVDVPLDQIGTGSRDIKTPHRIHMADGSEYAVRKFIVDETTLTIHELNPSDPRYGTTSMPVVLPLKDVTSIKKAEMGFG